MSARNICVNIIGDAGTGKTSLAQHLAETKGFAIFRPSDVIREYARSHQLALKARQDYVDAHRIMLAGDPEAITRPAIQLAQSGNLVIDGLRVIAHALEIKRAVGMFTICLTCPPEAAIVRYTRIEGDEAFRQYRDGAVITGLSEFLADEQADRGHTDPREPNIDLVMGLGDIEISALLPKEEVAARADQFIRSVQTNQP